MGNKMECPGCGAYGSDVFADCAADRPCRRCGLSAAAASEIRAVRASRADSALKEQLVEVLAAKGIAEGKLRTAERRLERIRDALEAHNPEFL